MVFKLPRCHEGSEYVLSFEIGQREIGFYSAPTDGQTDTPSTKFEYRFSAGNISGFERRFNQNQINLIN